MGTVENLLLGFSVALQPDVLWYAFLGCLVGTIVGVLPGIGPLSGISILLPATFGLDTTKSVVMLAGMYYGSQYGGSTTSILMRIPGEAASVMTCIDGYAMAQKGRAGAALCIAAVGSWIAGTFGVIVLTVVAPPLATIAVSFGPPEYTSLLVLGLIFLAYMSSTSLPRTLLMACFGLLLGTIGIDNMTGHFRYSFDIAELGDGIGIVPVAIGLFGLGEILSTPSATVVGKVIAPKLRQLLPNRREWRESAMPIARGLRAHAGARPSHRPDHRRADRRADDPRRAAGADAGERASQHLLGFRRVDVRRQSDVACAQFAAGRHLRERTAYPLRLSLSAGDHVLHHRRLRGQPFDRRCLDHADHGDHRLRLAQVRLRSGAAGARPRDRADPRDVAAPIADHVEWQLGDLPAAPDLARAAHCVRRAAGARRAVAHSQPQGLAQPAGRGRSRRKPVARSRRSDPAPLENRQHHLGAGKTWYRINPLFPAARAADAHAHAHRRSFSSPR